jgi:nuclear GTP-binding protein
MRESMYSKQNAFVVVERAEEMIYISAKGVLSLFSLSSQPSKLMSKKKKNSITTSDKHNNKNSNLRSRATEKRLKIYNIHPRRDSKGRILWEDFKSKSTQHHARIQPDRRWFGPTRTTTQSALQNFRESISKAVNGNNTVLLSNKNATDPLPAPPGLTVPRKEFLMVKGKIPYSLLYTRDHFTDAINNNILETESFDSTFGPKQTRKCPKLRHTDLTTLIDDANRRNGMLRSLVPLRQEKMTLFSLPSSNTGQ